jgi:hypothetical protein
VLAGALVTVMAVPDLLLFDAATFAVSALTLAAIRRGFNEQPAETGAAGEASVMRSLLHDVREGLRYVWNEPVLRSLSIMMALVNFVGASQYALLVLFAKRILGASDVEVAWLFAAGAAGVVVLGLAAGAIRRHLSFVVTALGALVVSGLALAGMAWTERYVVAVLLWAVCSGFGLLLNINTAALRQAIVPNHLLGRVMSVAMVLAWSAIPLGALAGAALIGAGVTLRGLYAGMGLATAAIAIAFAFSPIRHGDRLLAAAEVRKRPADAPGNDLPVPT